MYNSTLVEQFIKDIRVINLGQMVIIDCCPSVPFDSNETYEFRCLSCEEVKLKFYKDMKSCIDEDGCIDLLEFSLTKQKNGKISVYIYGRVVALEVICKETKIIK